MTYTMILRARQADTDHRCDLCGEAIAPGRFYAAGRREGRAVRHHYGCSWLGLAAMEVA